MKKFITSRPWLKKKAHAFLMNPLLARPRWYVRLFRCFYIHRARGSFIYRSARMDVVPFSDFSLGERSIIESYSVINNAVGPVRIGEHTRVGIGSTVIGPVSIGNHVIIAQHVLLSGLNHRYQDSTIPISLQGIQTNPIVIEDEVWIGGNAVILAGVTIGKHAVVAAGAVVTTHVDPYTIVAGNPARAIKRRSIQGNKWEPV